MSDISYHRLFQFFLPLAVTAMLIGSTHTITSATLARLPYPELSLAVFAVVRSLSNITKAPTLMSSQVVMAFIDDRKSYYLVRKTLVVMGGIFILVLFLMGYTPLGGWILRNIIGLKGKQEIEFAYLALRITCFLPVVEIFRNFFQGIAISLKKTNFIMPGIIIRLIAVFLFLWWSIWVQSFPGMIVGSIAWVGGIALEAILIYFYIKLYYGTPLKAVEQISEKNKGVVSFKQIIKFFIPLGLMMFVTQGLQPIVQSGIARGDMPTRSLAAYGVAWTLIIFVAGSLRRLHQCSLVFAHRPGTKGWQTVLRFSLAIGLLVGAIILIIAITPLGFWFINSVMAVPIILTGLVQQTMLAFSLYPLIRSFRESYWGLLMQRQTTNMIAIGKVVNLAVVIGSFIFFSVLFNLPTAVVGALAFTTGEGIETLIIWYYVSFYYTPEGEIGSLSS